MPQGPRGVLIVRATADPAEVRRALFGPVAGPGFELLVEAGASAGARLPLTAPRTTVGASRRCDLALSDARVQFSHLALHLAGDGVLVEGLARADLTVDGEALGKATRPLLPGQVVAVGAARLRLVEAGGGDAAAPPTHLLWEPCRAPSALREALRAAPGAQVPPAPGARGAVRVTTVSPASDAAAAVLAGWGGAWGVALRADATAAALAAHLGPCTALRGADRAPIAFDWTDGSAVARLLEHVDGLEAGALLHGARDGAPLFQAVVCAAAGQVLVATSGPEARRRPRLGAPGLQLGPATLAALGVAAPAGAPLREVEAPQPLVAPPEVLVDDGAGALARGALVHVGDEPRVRLPDGREVDLDGGARLVAGPRWQASAWPVARRTGCAPEALLAPPAPLAAWLLVHGPAAPERELDLLDGATPLTRGRLAPAERDRAALLAPCARDRALAWRGVEEGWASALWSAAPERVLLHHLRDLGRVRDARTGRTLAFKVTDPRNLAVLLPTLAEDDAAQVFGAARARDGASACPVCDEDLADPACGRCGARLHEVAGAPFLLAAIAARGGSGAVEVFQPAAVRGRAAPRRRARGRTALEVRQEQLEALGDDHARRRGGEGLEAPLLAHARAVAPKAVAALGEDGARAIVREAVGRAGAYGLWGEDAAATVLELLLVVDPAFDQRGPESRPVLEVLHDADLPPGARAERAFALALARAKARRADRSAP